jgi:mannose-6-phosphate isomerase
LAEAELACLKIAAAARGLWQYLCVEPAGLWHEVLTAEGSFAPGPSKASSFYHVVCAIDVLRQTVARGGMPLAPARP